MPDSKVALGYGETYDPNCTALLRLRMKLHKAPPGWGFNKFGMRCTRGWLSKLGGGRWSDNFDDPRIERVQRHLVAEVAALLGQRPADLEHKPERVSVKVPGCPPAPLHLDQNRTNDIQTIIVRTSASFFHWRQESWFDARWVGRWSEDGRAQAFGLVGLPPSGAQSECVQQGNLIQPSCPATLLYWLIVGSTFLQFVIYPEFFVFSRFLCVEGGWGCVSELAR